MTSFPKMVAGKLGLNLGQSYASRSNKSLGNPSASYSSPSNIYPPASGRAHAVASKPMSNPGKKGGKTHK